MKRIWLFLLIILPAAFACGQDGIKPTPQWRPAYHFTPLKNWTNDPNGLIFLDGKYHLYNQQNPYGIGWGHMSWGHATSTDLVHWEHLPLAMPETIDKDTTWRFSGSAVWDKNNTSGLCNAGGCLIAVYTADQPNLKKESQFIAYSNDRGRTFTNYVHNPVIDLNKRDFRDPNVTWSTQLNKWLMVVALPREYKVRFYASSNLRDWDLLSEFGPEGYTRAAWECPFLVPLTVEGKGSEKWVLVVSAGGAEKGTYMQYFTGMFDGRTFTNDNPSDTVLTVDYGDCLYAAIPWNGTPGKNKTYIGWLTPGPQATYPWTGQMSIPRDLSLRETPRGLRLVQTPAALIRKNLDNLSHHRVMEAKDLAIHAQKWKTMPGNAYWIEADITVDAGTTAGFLLAAKDNITGTRIGYDAAHHQLFVDRSHAGGGKIKAGREVQTIDATPAGKTLHLEILVDRSSLEVFADHGLYALSTQIFPDEDANSIYLYSNGGNAVINAIKIWDLSPVH
ncbi:MAG TPA: glycoside hydrolase family 32 protein [Puia sp.]|nr:glycoside hydrolase family 32 protein [Puia sp.]